MMKRKSKGCVLACIRDPCFAEITISHNGENKIFYCELEKNHKGSHMSALLWENPVGVV